ncbi:UDP-Glycosyltransferase/glycogen phosphorylase [Sistotremastrum suecicum HHB10207 ss-3]|uniref:Sterol 3-beta-glucosyltransferase n=1 Tax=Sistotremastrum suecicum HHB10207 ss-3 TaxID=1314776 RepID=A0A166B672_9AGAM|nr:UDP-Glycosyltransferase/glycogen phosphorylase [Sistotremastrum suecicum HHB10207 ss-3]
MSRAGSLATVRLMRRARLAEKLREVFELTEVNEVVAELPCWLLRSVLLQGYMYLTTTHLCFFAHMPSREDQILKSGSLQKKTNRTKRWIKHWFVLKNDALSWYQSSSDPYFPRGVVDLRYAISCEPSETKGFRIRTNQKTITLSADSTPSREEWVKAIRKVIFKAQNMGESVKISIPYSIIVDVEKSTAMDFSETIEVKVVDKEDNSIDSYFFAYFHEMDHALEQIRKVVQAGRVEGDPENHDTVRDTTIHRPFLTPSSSAPAAPSSPPTRVRSMPPTETSKGGTTTLFKIPSFLKSLSSTDAQSSGQPVSLPPDIRPHEEFTHVGAPPTQERAASSPVPLTRSVDQSQGSGSQVLSIPSTSSHLSTASDHTYPPSPSPPHLQPILSNEGSNTNWTVPVPSWLKSPSRRIFTSSSSRHPEQTGDSDHNAITEVVTASPQSTGDIQGDFGFSVLDPQSAGQDRIDHEDIEKFRHTFALDEREELLGCIPGYLFRVLPVPGRFYISNNLLCFRASQPISKTKVRLPRLVTSACMMIPLHDVLATEKSKAFRFSHHGLIVIIKGHEELFFEFSSLDRRRLFMELLNSQLEDVRRRSASGEPVSPSGAEKDAMVLEDLEPADLLGIAEPRPPPETMTESTPAVMFTSTSSTFITFKPEESLQFTLLTIGSRGDVQPYIALAKGLIAEGHKVRIATHGEFKEWIEGNDIEFTYVGGDPAELMRICVENGTFTVAFLREGLSKFRGWIDDLLQTSWDACQNTDVLIESPSAMSGIHIAEALQIPYFRAFTMPWTRTRAYPHAFAVPDRKMGGGYNYMTYVMFDQVFWRGTAGQINRWRKNVLGLAPTNLDKLEQHKVPFLYNFSPTVVPQPLDWYEWIRVTGYWFLDDADVSAKKWTPPTDLIEFIDEARQKNKKIVYIGFGSIVVSDPDAMTRCVVEAIVESGVYAILSKGWSDRLHAKKDLPGSPEAPLPPQIYKISSVPHDWLFQRIDAACHHGGAGTTGASLKAGIPTIIKPFFGDQFFWADRVEALGIGSSVRKLTVASLTAALLSATTDRKQIDRAKIIGQAIRSENGVKTAIECIYRDLEYAKSLIKKPTGDSADEDATISDKRASTPYSHISPERIMEHSVGSPGSSRGPGNAPSEDWSVISDEEDAKSVRSRGRPSSKRASMITKPFQVLQDVLSLS